LRRRSGVRKGRVQEDRALMDMRTVQPGETELIAAEVAGILGVK